MHVIVKNKRAYYDYLISEKYEAGVMLTGLEVRQVKTLGINISEGFVRVDKGEAWLWNCYIGKDNSTRKLLLNRKEINELVKHVKEKGFTIIPLCVGLSARGFVKIEIGIAKGKEEI